MSVPSTCSITAVRSVAWSVRDRPCIHTNDTSFQKLPGQMQTVAPIIGWIKDALCLQHTNAFTTHAHSWTRCYLDACGMMSYTNMQHGFTVWQVI